MAPRSYRLGRRAETAAATRERIIEAAAALYQAHGVNETTLQRIAERADVSRGTILHHFAGTGGVLDAVAERILVTLELPDERIFTGATDDESRLRAYVTAIIEFFQRSTGWWAVFMTEMDRPELKAREAAYYERIAALQARALGSLAMDRDVNIVVGSLIHPGTIGGFIWVMEQAGFGPAESVDAIADVVVAYVERARTTPASSQPGSGRNGR
ncbi:MAG TPA: TetR/AcrR family transcriptional regulator [Patescibacteria group bacterium]|jgi:AcrR family transcriptional regulator|nr:TetR/AcrR family transcriptional regulator [Patescibacteria group bacterium]